ncbi:MAG TPA: pyrroloquinoline quinone-dependent dehydrogenase [Acidobacteriota bacterium]|nr:pyrroloquinoline quinone-dependent dehydrogenase [Acidobacteriota bacterium]
MRLRAGMGAMTFMGLGLLLVASGVTAAELQEPQSGKPEDKGRWTHYGGDAGGSRFATAEQIAPDNVSDLIPAWTYRSGDVSHGEKGRRKSKFEATPILFEGRLYFSTPFSRVIALDPASGAELWTFDPEIDLEEHYSESLVTRGVAAWRDPQAQADAGCAVRIFFASQDARLHALDAASGRPCPGFASGGPVDLKQGVGKVEIGEYEVTSPPTVSGPVVVVGSAQGDNRRVEVEWGTVRAYDLRSGRLRWSFNPVPKRPGDPGWDAWEPDSARRTGAANAWSTFAADPERGLVFIPTGSAAPDFYGGERPGDNRYANSIVALRAEDGSLAWHFQVVHHDLWDYDIAAQPLLTTLQREGKTVPVVVANTKMGHVFVLHRESGKPVWPVEERSVPSSGVEGEKASPTQPFPSLPWLHDELKSPNDVFALSDEDRQACLKMIEGFRYEGRFTPPSLQGSIFWPGNVGGVNWGGAAVDPAQGIMVTNVNQLAFLVTLIPREDYRRRAQQARRERLSLQFTAQEGTPYGMSRRPFLAPSGVPCTPPPWGKTVALDLNQGKILWEIPSGFVKDLAQHPKAREFGSPTLGGPMITASGLVFVSGGKDERLHALDLSSGRQLWSAPLPGGGQATPMSYLHEGRQYIVIAAGGHEGLGTTLSDHLVAFALPEDDNQP